MIGLAFGQCSVGLSDADSPPNDTLAPYPGEFRSGMEVDVASS